MRRRSKILCLSYLATCCEKGGQACKATVVFGFFKDKRHPSRIRRVSQRRSSMHAKGRRGETKRKCDLSRRSCGNECNIRPSRILCAQASYRWPRSYTLGSVTQSSRYLLYPLGSVLHCLVLHCLVLHTVSQASLSTHTLPTGTQPTILAMKDQ